MRAKPKAGAAKMLSLLLAMLLLAGLLPLSAFAAWTTDQDATSTNVAQVQSYSEQLRADNTKENYTAGGFTWDTEGKSDSWRYFNGVMLDAFLMEGNTAYAEAFYDDNITVDAEGNVTIANYITGELDSVPAARGLFDLLSTSGNAEKYEAAIQYVYTQLEGQTSYSQCGGNYLHKQKTDGTATDSWSTWNIGLDGLYMAQPFLMECAKAIDEGTLTLTGKSNEVKSSDIYKEVYDRFVWVAENMYDEATGLYHHGWSVSSGTGNGHFWGRGIGWYAVALVDVIEMMPSNYQTQLIAYLTQLFDGMLKYQDKDTGMWYNVVNNPTLSGNKLETSVSSMMAYALMKAYVNGYVTDAKYAQAGLAAFNGVVANKMTGSEGSYTVSDTYQKSGVGEEDAYYTRNSYVDDEAKGVGALIMAATVANAAAEKLAPAGETAGTVTDADTGIQVSGTTATSIEVTDMSSNATVAAALKDKLSGYKAYDIELTGYEQGTAATVTMPAPNEADAVYYVSDDGTVVEEIANPTFRDGTVTFTTTHFSTFAAGVETLAETTVGASGSLQGGTTYQLVTDGRIESGAKYLIVSGSSGTAYALRNQNSSSAASQWVSISNGVATISNYESDCVWTFTSSSDGYTISNGSRYINLDKSNFIRTDDATITVSSANDNGFRLSQRSGTTTYYVRYNNSSNSNFSRSSSSSSATLYLFKQVTTAGADVSFSVSPSSVTLTKGSTAALTPTVLVSDVATDTYTITWTSNNTAVATVDNGVITAVADGSATITATLTSANGQAVNGTLSVTIPVTVTSFDKTQPNWGLNPAPADEYPEYPADGAVRIDKTATGQDFNSTGVVKVELDVAGISVKQGVDVILVVDVSNSMGWTDNWFEGMTAEEVAAAKDNVKIPKGTAADTIDKLDQAMASAQTFANILLGGNTTGSSSNNSLSFVTFAGFDKDNTNESGDRASYIDSVQTVFTNVQDASSANTAFANTKFTDYKVTTNSAGNTSVNFTLQIGKTNGTTVSGTNRGNTNYDYAFAEANAAVNALKNSYGGASAYAETGRETIVVFMTDGAPSHYNGNRLNGSHNDTRYGTKTNYAAVGAYNGDDADSAETWLTFINDPNTYAETLYSNIDSFYAVGFDLAHGGFGDYSFSEGDLQPVLEGLAGDNTVDVELVSNGEALNAFYRSLAQKIKLAGTEAQVTDTINSDFDLQMTQTTGTGDQHGTLSTAPTIEVTSYDLYTKADGVDTTLIGTRKENGATTLETVTFNADGTEAYSDQIDNGATNIMSTVDGVTTITAKYFTYTKNASGEEKFVWNLGDITDDEVVLSYYAYLTGTMEGTRAEGEVYYTNAGATLEYVDINGDYATKDFPMPAVAWGGATTSFEYYLVNEKGEPVNRAGQVVPFANRIVLYGDSVALNLNQDITIPAQTIQASQYLPEGYFLYDVNAYYTVSTASDSSLNKGITVSQPSEDAYKTTGTSPNQVTQTGAQTTIVVSPQNPTADETYIQTRVAFGVRWDLTPSYAEYELVKDQIVIDYGKAIQANVLANDTTIPTGYTGTLVGFTAYNANANLKQMQQSAGSTEYTTGNGTYTIVNGKVNFQLSTMLSEVEKVFCVVQVTETADTTNYYYLYEELDIIPATVMLYETDWSNVFTLRGSWTEYTFVDEVQDDGTIGRGQTYGYDSTYDTDNGHSNGSSPMVYGDKKTDKGPCTTTATFTFTGTGFDIISRTGEQQGQIRVTVTDINGTIFKSVKVLNKSESNLELYQIPVVSVNGLDYGTYTVIIEAYAGVNLEGTMAVLNRGNEFYFDAVRIYSPINASSIAGAGTDAGIAYAAYAADGQADPDITEVRQALITQDAFVNSEIPPEGTAIVFVDRKYSSAAGTEGVPAVTDYAAIGPDNETYLSKDQAIAFKVQWEGAAPASIDIGAKSANGQAVTMQVALMDSMVESSVMLEQPINSCTAQFYDLMKGTSDVTGVTAGSVLAGGSAYVVIRNTSKETGGVLSITDIKIAYGETSGITTLTVDAGVEAAAARAFAMGSAPEALDCDVESASFTTATARLLRTATMTVVTGEDVETLLITRNGRRVNVSADWTTAEGKKVWTVTIRMLGYGNQTYTVTGCGADGTTGASANASIRVKLF